MNQWYIYLLLCDQKTFYVGMTDSLESRLFAHRGKQSFFTKKFSEIELVHCEEYSTKREAAIREKQLKGWSVAKKEKLLTGELGINVCTGRVGVLGG